MTQSLSLPIPLALNRQTEILSFRFRSPRFPVKQSLLCARVTDDANLLLLARKKIAYCSDWWMHVTWPFQPIRRLWKRAALNLVPSKSKNSLVHNFQALFNKKVWGIEINQISKTSSKIGKTITCWTRKSQENVLHLKKGSAILYMTELLIFKVVK